MKRLRRGSGGIQQKQRTQTAILDFSYSSSEEGREIGGVVLEALFQGKIPDAAIVSPAVTPWMLGLATIPGKTKEVIKLLRKLLAEDPGTSKFPIIESRPWAAIFNY